MSTEHYTDAAVVRDLALAVQPTAMVEYTPYTVIPQGAKVENLEHLLGKPTRKRGTVSLTDANSFIAYVNRHKCDGTAIYGARRPAPKFLAVINDHSKDDGPGWGDHRATYDFPLSAEWTTWTGSDGKAMSQENFALFIEDNAPDCVSPPAADMLEISRSLEAKKKVNFASGIRLSNGQNEFTYEEEIQGTAAKGRLQVPEVFTIGIPVLEGGARYAVTARLRYRINAGALSMWFNLDRPHKVLDDAVNEVWRAIEAGAEVPMYAGTRA